MFDDDHAYNEIFPDGIPLDVFDPFLMNYNLEHPDYYPLPDDFGEVINLEKTISPTATDDEASAVETVGNYSTNKILALIPQIDQDFDEGSLLIGDDQQYHL